MNTGFSWGKPSFSRDFAILTLMVLFVLVLLSSWIIYETYNDHAERVVKQLETEATRIDRTLILELEQSSYLLESMGRQILHYGPNDYEAIAKLLRSFDTDDSINQLFAWINDDQRLIVSSTRGVLNKGMDVSDRDYMKKSIAEPWKVQIGRPVTGRVSGRWVVPLAMGINDYTGRYIGTILISIDVEGLTGRLKQSVSNPALNFGVVTPTFMTMTQSSVEPDFVTTHFPIDELKGLDFGAESRNISEPSDLLITYYQQSTKYPYILLLGLSKHDLWGEFFSLLWQRLLPTLVIGLIILIILATIRFAIIRPINELSDATDTLVRGEPVYLNVNGPPEVKFLGHQLMKISAYINERRRIELEQRNKMGQMKKAKEAAELSNRVKVEFLGSMSHELRTPLNTIAGFSEVMKNQVYGPIHNDRYKQYIDDIHQSSTQLQALITDVLALAKAEADLLELQEKPVVVPFIVNKCIRVLADRLRETDVTIENRVQSRMPRLLVDELRLKQIILNLLSNAIMHTPAGGSVVIDARMTDDSKQQPTFEIVVTDFGAKRLPGDDKRLLKDQMDEDGKPRLRNRYEIGHLSNLGIPLTKALVAMHQATLDIQSPPGKATQVIVRFPKERIVV